VSIRNPDTESSSASTSTGLFTHGASILSFPKAERQSQELADQLATTHIDQNEPLHSIEGGLNEAGSSTAGSDDSAGGVNISRTAHSRTPSLSLTPPPAEGTNTRHYSHRGDLGRGSASFGATNSIDGRLEMGDLTAAIEGVATSSDSPNALVPPQSPVAGNNPSQRRASSRRSSSRTSITPHAVIDEEPPQDRFHEPIFQQSLADAKQSMSELADVLSGSSFRSEPDSAIQRFHKEARNLALFHCPLTRTIGSLVTQALVRTIMVASKERSLKLTVYR